MEFFKKAFNIANDSKFIVRIYENPIKYTQTIMTYMELGTFLITNQSKIDIIHIFEKSE